VERALWEQLNELEEYRQLGRVRTDHVVQVREPMVLVSQIQRSGGTLLSRLFDGHPQCHAHPYELKIGRKARWPKLDLEAPETWFEALYEHKVAVHLVSGWSKPGLKETDVDVFPFLRGCRSSSSTLPSPTGQSNASVTFSTATSRRTSTPGSTTRICTRGRSGS
jgi:hypothetical protein